MLAGPIPASKLALTDVVIAESQVTNLTTDLSALNAAIALRAPLASPVLTGTPTAPTAAPATNTTQLATTAFSAAAIAAAIAAIPPPVWVAVSYSAANFTCGTGTWTVDSGDVLRYAYLLNGKTMTLSVWLTTTTVSATTADLRVAIPGGKVAAGFSVTAGVSGPAFEIGLMFTTAGAAYVSINRNNQVAYAPITNACTVAFTFTFEIQ
jgi:hypothetical protein